MAVLSPWCRRRLRSAFLLACSRSGTDRARCRPRFRTVVVRRNHEPAGQLRHRRCVAARRGHCSACQHAGHRAPGRGGVAARATGQLAGRRMGRSTASAAGDARLRRRITAVLRQHPRSRASGLADDRATLDSCSDRRREPGRVHHRLQRIHSVPAPYRANWPGATRRCKAAPRRPRSPGAVSAACWRGCSGRPPPCSPTRPVSSFRPALWSASAPASRSEPTIRPAAR